MLPIQGIYLVVILFHQLSAPDNLFVVILVEYQIGEVAVGKSHQHHVPVVVGTRSIALFVVYFVQHVKCLHYFRIACIFIRQPQIAFQCLVYISYSVVIYIPCIQQAHRGFSLHRVQLFLTLRQ